MKKKFLVALGLVAVLLMTGCNFGDGSNLEFDNSSITQVAGQEGYYTDSKLSFCAEIRGSYKSDRPFTLDSSNENLRVWDNYYLYEGDYFQMIVSDTPYIYYSVNSEDLVYVTPNDNSAESKVNEGQSGIYKITFDLTTKIFDLEYKSEITTPVYETMSGCDVYSLKSNFTQMTVNPNNDEELMIENYQINAGEMISFHNHGNYHLSQYKVVLDEAVQGKYASALEDGDKFVSFSIGGLYNLYINPVTYALRVELTNPDTASYSLKAYKNGEPVSCIVDENTPYIFRHQVTVKVNGSIPIFINDDYFMYDLTVNESEYFDNDYEMFNVAGTYDLEINLKLFTITVTYVPQ